MSQAASAEILPEQPTSAWRDFLGIAASLVCAVHCAAMPFLIAYLPALGLSFLADESFHQWMTVTCLLLALIAFVPGWRTHRRWLPGMTAGVGLIIIASAAYGHTDECCAAATAAAETEANESSVTQGAPQDEACPFDCCQSPAETGVATPAAFETNTDGSFRNLSAMATWWTPLGGLLLVSAHLLNRRYTCCSCCSPAMYAGDELLAASGNQSS
ncbi:MAG: MerC domain-containing protein [Fuerstiella sp.]|nr:MerC domain-containing protein [Fuerstiella sp.]